MCRGLALDFNGYVHFEQKVAVYSYCKSIWMYLTRSVHEGLVVSVRPMVYEAIAHVCVFSCVFRLLLEAASFHASPATSLQSSEAR